MNIQAEKLSVLQQILNTDDVSLIRDIKFLISNREMDWFDELTKKQQADIQEGIRQLDQGEVFSHQQVKDRLAH